jgi:hypothetical protein
MKSSEMLANDNSLMNSCKQNGGKLSFATIMVNKRLTLNIDYKNGKN